MSGRRKTQIIEGEAEAIAPPIPDDTNPNAQRMFLAVEGAKAVQHQRERATDESLSALGAVTRTAVQLADALSGMAGRVDGAYGSLERLATAAATSSARVKDLEVEVRELQRQIADRDSAIDVLSRRLDDSADVSAAIAAAKARDEAITMAAQALLSPPDPERLARALVKALGEQAKEYPSVLAEWVEKVNTEVRKNG